MNALIIAAGEKPSPNLAKKRASECDLLIAVDKGLEVYKEIGIMPNFIVGDMDSVKPALLKEYASVKKLTLPTHKNETDTHMALEVAFKQTQGKIYLLGGLGLRQDHALSNIMLLKYACRRGRTLIMEDDIQTMYAINSPTEIQGKKGQTVSIIPINSFARVTASGLMYPLENLLLTNARPRGVSNVFTHTTAFVNTKQYVLICLIK